MDQINFEYAHRICLPSQAIEFCCKELHNQLFMDHNKMFASNTVLALFSAYSFSVHL